MLYTHNPKKPKGSYHLATDFGTVCKMENSCYYQYQVRVPEIPGKKILCGMCKQIANRPSGPLPFSLNGMLRTIWKLYSGVLPGGLEWSPEDQEHVEAARKLV